MKKNIFIGGAWPYANNSLHIGHLAALLPADIIARYYRENDCNVLYVSGTDSHGTPITERAKKEGVEPKQIAELYHNQFVKNFNELNFSYDLYTSTMTEYHAKKVQEYFKRIIDNGYVYERLEDQDYCEECHQFLSDREIVGTCPHCGGSAKGDQCDECNATLNQNELLDKKCKTCGKQVVTRKNKHLYFSLSKFQDIINDLIKENENVWRKNAVNESKKFLDMQLIDRAATRQLTWGIEVPVEGYEDKKIYVWIEAVMGYITAGELAALEKGWDFDNFIKKDNDNLTYYVHGKDNIPFHTIIFPALLSAIDSNYQLPQKIISSEYVNMNDEKMSKSKGNLITINELVSKYNPDTIRYYMIANGPENKDINFSLDDLVQTHNKFLVGVLGNFINRNLSFIQKKFDGLITEGKIDENIRKQTEELYTLVGKDIEDGNLRDALSKVIQYAILGNKYYDEEQPWIQVKDNMEGFNNTTYTCVYMMANLANLLSPFIPTTAKRIKKMLNINDNPKWQVANISGDILINSELLFERIENN